MKLPKKTVGQYLEHIVNTAEVCYLRWPMSRWELSLLIKFRMSIVHHMLCFPLGCNSNEIRGCCPCDGFSDQTELHFILFCKFYVHPRRLCILPVLKAMNIAHCRLAVQFLKLLSNAHLCFRVGSFLKIVVQLRKSILL